MEKTVNLIYCFQMLFWLNFKNRVFFPPIKSWEIPPGRWVLGEGVGSPKWVPMLEQRIDDRTLNSVFQVSVKTTLFADLSEKLSFFIALLRTTCIKGQKMPPFEIGLSFHILQLTSCRLQNKDLNM